MPGGRAQFKDGRMLAMVGAGADGRVQVCAQGGLRAQPEPAKSRGSLGGRRVFGALTCVPRPDWRGG